MFSNPFIVTTTINGDCYILQFEDRSGYNKFLGFICLTYGTDRPITPAVLVSFARAYPSSGLVSCLTSDIQFETIPPVSDQEDS